MRGVALLVALLFTVLPLAGCFDAGPVTTSDEDEGCPKINGRETTTSRWVLETPKGTIIAELCDALVPRTVEHFANLTERNVYQDATFYRVVGPTDENPDGFVIQAGLQTKPASVQNIRDELHPALRHDRAGVLSVAHAGPHTGSTEFFITLGPTPHLDDRHTVFGYVVQGLSTVRTIGAVETDSNDAPTEPIPVTRVAIQRHTQSPDPVADLTAYAPAPHRAGEPNVEAIEWPVVVLNRGNAPDDITVAVTGPDGWTGVNVDRPTQLIGAGSGAVYLARALPPADTPNGTYNITVTVTSGLDDALTTTVPLTLEVKDLGEAIELNDRVEVHYVGLLEDGRMFDTSFSEPADDAAMRKFAGTWREKDRGTPPAFTVGNGTVTGFVDLLVGTKVGESAVDRIPPAKAYGAGTNGARPNVYEHVLVGKTLVFDLHVVRIVPPTNSTA